MRAVRPLRTVGNEVTTTGLIEVNAVACAPVYVMGKNDKWFISSP